jgi:hypothetical protein
MVCVVVVDHTLGVCNFLSVLYLVHSDKCRTFHKIEYRSRKKKCALIVDFFTLEQNVKKWSHLWQ